MKTSLNLSAVTAITPGQMIDMAADASDHVQVRVVTSPRRLKTIYIDVNGVTVLRVGGIGVKRLTVEQEP